MSALKDYLAKYPDAPCTLKKLPLMHSCDCSACRRIIDDDSLKICNCKVFNEDLLYFFYGKPSYPVSEKIENNRTDFEYCPICFIAPLEKVSLYKVHPFDTGAFCANMYKDFFHHSMGIEEFELDNTVDSILKYISIFFGNNENYIMGQSTVLPSSVAADDPVIKGLVSLLTSTGAFQFDERANTIEIMSRNSIPISTSIECVILPENLLRVSSINRFLQDNNIYHMEYTVRLRTAPSRYNEVVFEKAMEYIKMRRR